MKKYWVTIRATVTKTLTVTAKDEESAVQEAHEMFSILVRKWDKAWDWFQTYTANTDLELWVEQSPPDILDEKQLELNL